MFKGEGDTDAKRESISGLTDPVWWKLKTARYRGAVYEDADGQAWLCAAGLRRAGEADDFYADFMAKVSGRGPSHYLPTDADRRRLRLELADARLVGWEARLHALACEALASVAGDGGTVDVDVPGLRSAAQDRLGGDDADVGVKGLGTARVDVVVVPDEDAAASVAEIVLTVDLDRSKRQLSERAELVLLAALNPDEQGWDSSWTADGAVYASLLSADELRAHVSGAAGRAPGLTSPGRHAHYAHKRGLTESAVEGLGVRAMCGTWFVPRQDADSREVCPSCQSAYGRLRADD